MIKTCPNCGGLFCTPPDTSFAGKPCSCRYSESVVAVAETELVKENTRLRAERDQWREDAENLKRTLNLFNCEGYEYKEEVTAALAAHERLVKEAKK